VIVNNLKTNLMKFPDEIIPTLIQIVHNRASTKQIGFFHTTIGSRAGRIS
jgi:hypothetical protein